ncbi:hypothetical protein [Tateyamaria sp. syn59]|uniref:hypothetical protein n=1 Tax=Tateyamaria sp. syn59 TaxID=2576942 RepID=UPI001CB98397|nr:hypothetical protein [Tateyamaria sp. syn59]
MITDNAEKLRDRLVEHTGERTTALDTWLESQRADGDQFKLKLDASRTERPASFDDLMNRDRASAGSPHRNAERAAERDMANGPAHAKASDKDAQREADKDAKDSVLENTKDAKDRQLSFFEDPDKRAELRNDIKEIENYAERVRERNKEIER